MPKIAWLIAHNPENGIIHTDALFNMQAAAIACINYALKKESIIAEALYPSEASQNNTTLAKGILIFTDSKETITECQIHSSTNRTAQAIQKKQNKLLTQLRIQV